MTVTVPKVARRVGFGLLAALVAVVAPLAVPHSAGAQASSEPPAVAGELLVGFDAGASTEARAAARRSVNARVKDVVAGDVELLALPANADRRAAEARLRSQGGVRYAEPNWIYTHDATSADPSFVAGSLWGLYGDASSPSNAYGSQAAEAWAAGTTGDAT